MKPVRINGREYKATEYLGWQPSVGGWVKFVEDGKRRRAVIRYPKGHWQFWKTRMLAGPPPGTPRRQKRS